MPLHGLRSFDDSQTLLVKARLLRRSC